MSKFIRYLEKTAPFLMGLGLAMAISKYNSNWLLGTFGLCLMFAGMELRYGKTQ